MKNTNHARISLILAMVIFGTVGIFRKNIPLSSGLVAAARGILGVVFLAVFTAVKKIRPDRAMIRKHLVVLLISGMFIGLNWVLLFESYRYTSVAVATLCYYMAPVFVVVASPFVLKEHVTLKTKICVAAALLGMVFVSGVLDGGISEISELRGMIFGLGAAAFYALVILLNQSLKEVPTYDKTMVQLGAASVVLLMYIFTAEELTSVSFVPMTVCLLFVVGIVHTGIAYVLYFDSMKELSARTVALFGYIDPIVAIILSALFLKEEMGAFQIAGAVLVLGSAFVNELPKRENRQNKTKNR
ncbi:MAG: DMT family transporter [Lachnospiraceae bacterium]